MALMAYREENGQVVLIMSRDDYERILGLCAIATAASKNAVRNLMFTEADVIALLNRLNQGNPNYTPYQVEEKKPTRDTRNGLPHIPDVD